MKYFVILFGFLILLGFTGIALATHDPAYNHSMPFGLSDSKLSPLKQIQSGIKFHNVECNEGTELVYKKANDMSACVSLTTKIELVVRGWAEDNRILLGCMGERIPKCYPDDTQEYRKILYEYYFGSDEGLPTYKDLNISKMRTINGCTSKPSICFGEFENGTQIRISCDYPLHGCGVKSFDNYKEVENEESVHSLPFGWVPSNDQKTIEPIYIENPNNPGELILDIDAMQQVQKILDKCTYKQKLESGEIPVRNPDGSYNAITGSLRFYNNGTHYIDDNICKWIDFFEAVTYHCFEANPMEQNWYFGPDYFDNGTHHLDVQKCQWINSEEYLKLPLCDTNPEQDFGKCREMP